MERKGQFQRASEVRTESAKRFHAQNPPKQIAMATDRRLEGTYPSAKPRRTEEQPSKKRRFPDLSHVRRATKHKTRAFRRVATATAVAADVYQHYQQQQPIILRLIIIIITVTAAIQIAVIIFTVKPVPATIILIHFQAIQQLQPAGEKLQ